MGNYKQRLLRDEQVFSDAAHHELQSLLANTIRFVHNCVAFLQDDPSQQAEALLADAEALGDEADQIRIAHLDRVQAGTCDALAGMTFSDMIVALRRIKNHSVNLIDAKVSRWEEQHDTNGVSGIARRGDLGRVRVTIQRNSQAPARE